ncbi:MAG: FHA domain-containing protein, partial [Chloroflexi bacterium]|nr:FHA domain-containing protein [Chloroflexota bacterium]
MYGTGGPQYGRSDTGGTARLVYQGVRYTIPPGGLRVGRDGSNGLVIADSSVSRQHLVLWTTPQGIFARDLGSHNGTFVNGYRLGAEPVLVRSGDRIQTGPAELVVEVEAA